MKFHVHADTRLSDEQIRQSTLFLSWLTEQRVPVAEVMVNGVGYWDNDVQMLQLAVKVEGGKWWEYFQLRLPTVDVLTMVTDGTRRRVVFVRQYRPALGQWILSNPAGGIDRGETPEDAGVREVREELGLDESVDITISRLIDAPCAATPGGINEQVLFMFAVIHLTPGGFDKLIQDLEGKQAGLAAEGEEVAVVTADYSDALTWVTQGEEIPDAKTILSLAYERAR